MISSISSMNSMTSMMQMRQQMFSKIDTNGDGKHDADELSAMVANDPQGGPGVEDILARFDTDGDGSVSESEFSSAYKGPAGAMPPGMSAMSTEDLIAQMFSEADENGDGVIDETELAQMAAKGPGDGPGAEELMSRLDTDGDGAISETEFAEGPWANKQVQGPPPPPPQEGNETGSIFSRLDTDGDGTISEAEFETAMNSIESFFSSISTGDSDRSVSDLMGLLGAALNAYQQASGTSHDTSVQASRATGSSLYA